ncbi:MAG: TonB-dependent receptor plug domain-containing protein [Pseudomonadota bacterium]
MAKATHNHDHDGKGRRRTRALTALMACSALSSAAWAQDDEGDVIVVQGSLRALPVEDVGSVFGFDKNLVETPRSASTISSEQIERFGITDIYGLVAQAPGTFTNSFFGVGGSLDVRGSPGEVYFRGVRRLDNPGNYPTPIGASDRIDIVRGPASPIYGPAKIGGYINFVPKTARVAGGKLLDAPQGEVSYTTGSWDKSVLTGQVTGPASILGQEFGYHVFAQVENSGSYYNNIATDQTIIQAAFDTYLTENIRLEFGGMYHDFEGDQNGGWNRLTQDLVDNGTYITGTAQPLDTDNDGQLSPSEFFVGEFSAFRFDPASVTDADLDPIIALENTGTTTLSRRDVLTGPNDLLENIAETIYFDVIYESDSGLEVKNQFFYDSSENLNENSYGFSQLIDSWVIEDKIVVSKTFELDGIEINSQVSPSLRYTNFEQADDFFFEYFHRVDLTQGYDALSDRLLSTEEGQNFSGYVEGDYLNLALAALVDVETDFGLTFLLGGRYDYIDAEAEDQVDLLIFPPDPSDPGLAEGEDKDVAWSYTASVSYELPFGVIPYATWSEQSSVVAGQGAEISTENLRNGTWLTEATLEEFGVKGNFFDDRLYAALAFYEQERVDFSAQQIVTNQAVKTEGIEAEFRWAVTDNLLLTGAYTNTEVVNLTALQEGSLFSFFGIEDLVNVSDPTLHLGGQPFGLLPITNESEARRAGIPENIYSFTATYQFDNGLAIFGTVTDVEEVFAGQSQSVELPSYTLVDLGASYETENWLFRVNVKNLTDEEYFRANFTELFGSTIALPELPRHIQATVSYKF